MIDLPPLPPAMGDVVAITNIGGDGREVFEVRAPGLGSNYTAADMRSYGEACARAALEAAAVHVEAKHDPEGFYYGPSPRSIAESIRALQVKP